MAAPTFFVNICGRERAEKITNIGLLIIAVTAFIAGLISIILLVTPDPISKNVGRNYADDHGCGPKYLQWMNNPTNQTLAQTCGTAQKECCDGALKAQVGIGYMITGIEMALALLGVLLAGAIGYKVFSTCRAQHNEEEARSMLTIN